MITTFESGLPSSLRAGAYAFQFPENKSVVPGNSNLKWTEMWKSLFYKCAPASTVWRNPGTRFPLVRQKRHFISGHEIIVGGREGKTGTEDSDRQKTRGVPFRMKHYDNNLEILKPTLPLLRSNIGKFLTGWMRNWNLTMKPGSIKCFFY